MGGRSAVIERLLTAFLLGAFIFFILPFWRPTSFIATTFLLLGIGIISLAVSRFLSGESDRLMLVVVALVIVAEGIVFAINPAGL